MRGFLGVTFWLTAGSALLGCSVGDDTCRSSSECSSPEECATPNDAPVCGIPCSVDRACTATSCGAGMACEELLGNCCGPSDPVSSRCVTACTATSCAAGDRCAASGACEAIPCTEGYTCPTQWRCLAPGAGGDRHGCQRIPCTSDGECQRPGYCVSGQCRDALGTCEVPMLVP